MYGAALPRLLRWIPDRRSASPRLSGMREGVESFKPTTYSLIPGGLQRSCMARPGIQRNKRGEAAPFPSPSLPYPPIGNWLSSLNVSSTTEEWTFCTASCASRSSLMTRASVFRSATVILIR